MCFSLAGARYGTIWYDKKWFLTDDRRRGTDGDSPTESWRSGVGVMANTEVLQ